MKRLSVHLGCLVLAGCGSGLDDFSPDDSPATPTDDTPTTSTTTPIEPPPGNFTTPSTWTESGETWVVEVDNTLTSGLPGIVLDIQNDWAFEVLVDDVPNFRVLSSSVFHGSLTQDPCVVTTAPPPGESSGNGFFSIDLELGDVDLGQPWRWESVHVEGTRDLDSATIHDLVWNATIPAADLARAVFGIETDACVTLESFGLTCMTCPSDPEGCVELDFEATGTPAPSLVIEPINLDDVRANPSCSDLR